MRTLKVTVTKNGDVFLNGTFDVSGEDYPVVEGLLNEINMTREQAASMLSGYMHARDAGNITDEMGKLAMVATVYMLAAGETDIIIPLEASVDTS
ncbi:hypothetical protein [Kordiimonas aquimaris]|uniref:hypothetical protein n=1 Tax=Kordiimonas aquimaris TaxID=707591 RepID=UPI0021D118C0|nr:hypothetical protein [Kordiimonas aquimaris]